MSIFKEHKTGADRSASDRSRHRKKIEKAIREGVHNIVAEESIIGQEGKKKIRIPVRGIKEYQFVYGDNENSKSVGSAPGKDIGRGQPLGPKQKKDEGGSGSGKPGNQKGEEYYEVEITLEELAAYLFDSLELPELERKYVKKIMSEKMVRKGYRNEGIRPRLDKKQTVMRKIRRKSIMKRRDSQESSGEHSEEERFPFHNDDLKYKHIKSSFKESSNAVIFFIMDISGSMTKQKKYIARSFFFLLYQFIRHRYENTEIVFVAHDTEAYECNEDQFFSRGSGGGTLVSSALEMADDIISKRFHPSVWNIYSFHCSDGDNWPQDTEKTIELTKRLKDISQLYGYCEIRPEGESFAWNNGDSELQKSYVHLQDSRLKIVNIKKPQDIWPSFKKLFGGKLDV